MRFVMCLACTVGLTLCAPVRAESCFCVIDQSRRVYRDCREGFAGAARTRFIECKLRPGPLRDEIELKPGMNELREGEGECDPCELAESPAGRSIRTGNDTAATPASVGHE